MNIIIVSRSSVALFHDSLTMGPPGRDRPLTAATPTGEADSQAITARPIVNELSRHNGAHQNTPPTIAGGVQDISILSSRRKPDQDGGRVLR